MGRKYYFHNGKEKTGPFDTSELEKIGITSTYFVWYIGLPTWISVKEVDELKAYLEIESPPPFVSKEANDVTSNLGIENNNFKYSNYAIDYIILHLIARGRKLGAIAVFKNYTGFSLSQAKNYVVNIHNKYSIALKEIESKIKLNEIESPYFNKDFMLILNDFIINDEIKLAISLLQVNEEMTQEEAENYITKNSNLSLDEINKSNLLFKYDSSIDLSNEMKLDNIENYELKENVSQSKDQSLEEFKKQKTAKLLQEDAIEKEKELVKRKEDAKTIFQILAFIAAVFTVIAFVAPYYINDKWSILERISNHEFISFYNKYFGTTWVLSIIAFIISFFRMKTIR